MFTTGLTESLSNRSFSGPDKPEDANEFLQQFFDECIDLCNVGLDEGGTKVSIECLSCDTPAKVTQDMKSVQNAT